MKSHLGVLSVILLSPLLLVGCDNTLNAAQPATKGQPVKTANVKKTAHPRQTQLSVANLESVGVRMLTPVFWTRYRVTRGDSWGYEWVNPADKQQAVVLISSGCIGCVKNKQGQWDVTGAIANVRWTHISSDKLNGSFIDTTHRNIWNAGNAQRGPTRETYVGHGQAYVFTATPVHSVVAEVWGPAALTAQIVSSIRPTSALTGGSAQTKTTRVSYNVYVNHRFRFRIDYPRSFVADAPPENGDGQTWRSPDGQSTLTVSGSFNSMADTIESTLHRWMHPNNPSIRQVVTYQSQGPNWFILSGYTDPSRKMIFYMKMFVGKTNTYMFRMTYPSSQAQPYSSIVQHVEAGFTPGPLS